MVDLCRNDIQILEALSLHFEMLDFSQECRFVHQFGLLLAADVLIFAVHEENLVIIHLIDIITDLSRC